MIIRKHKAGSLKLGASDQGFGENTGVDHTMQKLDARLNFWKEEWFADLRLGMPYKQDILGRKVPNNIVQGIVEDAITITAGIDRVLSVLVTEDRASRVRTVVWKARASDGTVLSSKPFIVGNSRS